VTIKHDTGVHGFRGPREGLSREKGDVPVRNKVYSDEEGIDRTRKVA